MVRSETSERGNAVFTCLLFAFLATLFLLRLLFFVRFILLLGFFSFLWGILQIIDRLVFLKLFVILFPELPLDAHIGRLLRVVSQ